jgi:hypothetical protein
MRNNGMAGYDTSLVLYPALAIGLLEAVSLLPGVMAADVVVQETEHERENGILESVARCKIEGRPPRGFAVTLGRTRRNAGGETYRYWRITRFHRHPCSVVRPTLWIMTARRQNPLHVVMNAEGFWELMPHAPNLWQ